MPDILEIQKAVSAEWMGARATLSTYEWFNTNTLESVTCPQIIVEVPKADKRIQAWVQIHPDLWPETTMDFVMKFFRSELSDD